MAYPVSMAAAADLRFLQLRLGADRVSGPDPVDGHWEVTLVRASGLRCWVFGDSPEAALAKARTLVEQRRNAA